MKSIIALSFACLLTFSGQVRASDISTSVFVGVVVANYAGAAAGVAASSLLAGTAIVARSGGKEAVAKAVVNDVQDFYLTGNLSLALENSINSIQAMDSSISDEEAVDMILESIAE